MTIDRPNLAGAFATKTPVDRAAGLAGLLPPARRSTPPASPAAEAEVQKDNATIEPSEPTASTEPVAERQPEPRSAPSRPVRSIRTTTAPRVSDSADVPVNIAVYLEPDVLQIARARTRADAITYDELVVRAFADITDDQLQRTFQPDTPAHGGPAMPTRQRRLRGTSGIQIQLRLTANQRTWLEEKRHTVGAPSRSALVATALRLHLTP